MCSSDLGQQEGFQLYLPPFYDVSHVVLHTWEETLEGRFIADYYEAVVGTIDEEATRGGGEEFFSPYIVA